MDQYTHTQQKVSAIVPAYNEAKRIEKVLKTLTSFKGFCEVIVIDDGSTDETAKVAAHYPVTLLKNEKNKGKAQALEQGINISKGEILFFCDADISGLTHEIITQILSPVLEGKVDMFIAMRNRRIYVLSHIITVVPLFGGERALKKELWYKVPAVYKKRFRIEAALNFYAKYYGNGYSRKLFRGMSQTIKEQKYGLWQGLKHRLIMLSDIFVAAIRLHFIHIPSTIQSIRLTFGTLLSSIGGVALGILILIGTHVGPKQFVLQLFQKELRQDPDAPFVNFLLYITSVTSVEALTIIGWAIAFINFVMLLLELNQLFFLLQHSKLKLRNIFLRVKPVRSEKNGG